jgi:D-glycero-D-manno-heptose 1,7-bisphosphate phosphatase
MAQFETHRPHAGSPAIFLDRDGIVNVRRIDDYVKRWEEFTFLPEIFEVLPEIHRMGLPAVLVTNQRGIGRGLMSEEDLAEIHAAMQRELELRCGHRFDAIYHCPHERDAGCSCRKPLPGMLLTAGADLGVDLGGSWMIGDSESDIEAGLAAGCHTAKVDPDRRPSAAEIVAPDLGEAWQQVRRSLDRQRAPR